MQRPNREMANLLFDHYGALLTQHQQEAWRLYYLEDWSLMEIAQSRHVTRAAIHDLLNRTAATLEAFEASLHLLDQMQRRQRLLEKLTVAVRAGPQGSWRDQAEQLLAEMAGEEDRGDV